MHETSLSLLNRLQREDDSTTWNRLVDLYTPLLQKWLQSYDVQASDADDLVQDVLLAVWKDAKKFDHNGRPGAFRAWLRSIVVNRLRNFWRGRKRRPQARADSDLDRRIAELEDPTSAMSRFWDQQHDLYVIRQLLALSKSQFSQTTWKAFSRVAIDGHAAHMVAEELGISINAVFIAKSRVLTRLRQEAEGLIDSASDFQAKS